MDIITWGAVAMLSLGGIGGAYVTWCFRNQMKSYQEDLKTLSEETIELSRITKNLITGGDSYARIIRSQVYYGEERKTLYYIKLIGEFPLRDLNVEIIDISGLNTAAQKKRKSTGQYLTEKEIDKFKKNLYYPTIIHSKEYKIDEDIMDKIFLKERRDIVIQFNLESEQSEILQREKIVDVWGKYICGTRIQFTDGSKEEIVDDGFPKNERGENFWHVDKSEYLNE